MGAWESKGVRTRSFKYARWRCSSESVTSSKVYRWDLSIFLSKDSATLDAEVHFSCRWYCLCYNIEDFI